MVVIETEYNVLSRNLVDGYAYMSNTGVVYIANKVNSILGFSLCGRYVLSEGSSDKLKKITVSCKIRDGH